MSDRKQTQPDAARTAKLLLVGMTSLVTFAAALAIGSVV